MTNGMLWFMWYAVWCLLGAVIGTLLFMFTQGVYL